MSAIHLGTYTHDDPTWHQLRATRLGGSEIAAVIGLSKWESRFSLWHRKQGLTPPQDVSDVMNAGTLLEPVLAAAFAAKHPEHSLAEHPGTYVHRERDWQLANPDALLYPNASWPEPHALLETKFSTHGDDWGDEGTDQVPPYYACQAQHYMDVLDLPVCYFEVFIGARGQFATYVLPANAADQELLRNAGAEFMRTLRDNERPNLDDHTATYEAVKALHPQIDPVDVDLPAKLAREFCQAQHALKAAKALEQAARTKVADLMGTAKTAKWDGLTIARRQAKGDSPPYVVAGKGLPDFTETSAAA